MNIKEHARASGKALGEGLLQISDAAAKLLITLSMHLNRGLSMRSMSIVHS